MCLSNSTKNLQINQSAADNKYAATQPEVLTGRNTTGPQSRAAPNELRCIYDGVIDDNDRCQRVK